MIVNSAAVNAEVTGLHELTKTLDSQVHPTCIECTEL